MLTLPNPARRVTAIALAIAVVAGAAIAGTGAAAAPAGVVGPQLAVDANTAGRSAAAQNLTPAGSKLFLFTNGTDDRGLWVIDSDGTATRLVDLGAISAPKMIAMPGDTGKTSGFSAGTRSITVRRVSTLVPCRA